MPIQLQTETCLSLAQAAKRLPRVRGEKPPHPMTLYRWATTGLKAKSGKRVVLESMFIGGTRVTSLEALERFFARRNDIAYNPLIDASESTRQSITENSKQAMGRLRALGMID